MIRGNVVLMGSGELSATMVETHKKLLALNRLQGKALFLDTPAGFQENVDLISQRVSAFFKNQVGHTIEIASFKSADETTEKETADTMRLLSEGNYVLIGPGSPTYTVRQLKNSSIPSLLNAMITKGGCLTISSAAALTVGSHTLPVYEIYKVGEDLHWIEGLDILGHLGLNLIAIPHWNNAEGGNHDTRYCYMGEKRFHLLEKMLPSDQAILGIDEHTALIIDFYTNTAIVEGLGNVTVRRSGAEHYFARGEKVSINNLLKGPLIKTENKSSRENLNNINYHNNLEDNSFWKNLHSIESAFNTALDQNDSASMITKLLEADRLLWQAQLERENPEFISQGREIYREMIVLAGTGIKQTATIIPQKFTLLVEGLLELRNHYRKENKWSLADEIRQVLQEAGVTVEDTAEGTKWRQ